ncbi:hypothetical protein GCM10022267_79490 [Lentzea roselyniae]|uniref:Uncharacterized protein n=1 Tax=Lentzea roselyniae TaxID=531940 RepID=A0ABP7C5V8_9PSEU
MGAAAPVGGTGCIPGWRDQGARALLFTPGALGGGVSRRRATYLDGYTLVVHESAQAGVDAVCLGYVCSISQQTTHESAAVIADDGMTEATGSTAPSNK